MKAEYIAPAMEIVELDLPTVNTDDLSGYFLQFDGDWFNS